MATWTRHAGSAEAVVAIRSAGRQYVDLLRGHIQKEDRVLFQMAIRALTAEDTANLAASFQAPGDPRLSPETRVHYEVLAEELCGAPDASVPSPKFLYRSLTAVARLPGRARKQAVKTLQRHHASAVR